MGADSNNVSVSPEFVEKKICEVIVEQLGLEVEEGKSIMDSKLVHDLGADSLDIVECVMQIEDVFKIEIGDSEFDSMDTVRDLVDFVCKMCDAKHEGK